jgi:hypothetical protein
MDKIEILHENGYFFINGKKYQDCNPDEQEFFNRFIRSNKELVNKILNK